MRGGQMPERTNPFNLVQNQEPPLLAFASLFKEDFSIDSLSKMFEIDPSEISLALEEGIQQGWIIRKGQGIFRFSNLEGMNKWQETLSIDQKRQVCMTIAKFLTKEVPDNDEKIQAVANYPLLPDDYSTIYPWLITAGNLFYKSGKYKKALECYTTVLKSLSARSSNEIDLLFIKASIEFSKLPPAIERTKNIISVLNEAVKRAKTWNKNDYLSILEMHLATSEWLRSRHQIAFQHFKKGWSLIEKVEDPKLLRSANILGTCFLFWQGRFREVIKRYESSAENGGKFSEGRFPIISGLAVGQCYAVIGNLTQGIGMLDAIRNSCRQRGDEEMDALARITMGILMVGFRRADQAIKYSEEPVKDPAQRKNYWMQLLGNLVLALAYYLKNEKKQSIHHLNEFFQLRQHVQITTQLYPFLLELLWAMEEKKLPHIPGFSFEKEIDILVKGRNIFMKGIAYKYKALLTKKEGRFPEKIIHFLNLSRRWLEESGHQIELARVLLLLAEEFLTSREEEKAKETNQAVSKILSSINETLIPDDLQPFIYDLHPDKSLIHKILNLGHEIVSNRDVKTLVQQIISTGNQITGAERGAIFIFEADTKVPKLRLEASKSLSPNEIHSPNFGSSMEMIAEVARTGRSQIQGIESKEFFRSLPNEIIRSRICVPMTFQNKVVGVLYHDNRLLTSLFKETDIGLLAYFASQAAIALDNARAYEEIKLLNKKLNEEKLYFKEQQLQSIHFEDIIGDSPCIINVLKRVDLVAATDTSVLIQGETGVGKEVIARAIHKSSSRASKPFIRVFCSALPESLIPSELFGHEKGAFTGATNKRVGRFELADGGTLFLDEIGELSLEVQVRLLQVLETKEFERVGGAKPLGRTSVSSQLQTGNLSRT